MKKTKLRILFTLIALIVLNVHCGSAGKLLSSGSPLLSSLGGNSNLSTITSLLQTPGLGKLLGGSLKKPFTLLAPSNNAFQSLGTDALGNLTKPENLSSLAGLLKGHIIPGKLDASSLSGSGLQSAAGKVLNLNGANLGNVISSDKFNIIPIDKLLQ